MRVYLLMKETTLGIVRCFHLTLSVSHFLAEYLEKKKTITNNIHPNNQCNRTGECIFMIQEKSRLVIISGCFLFLQFRDADLKLTQLFKIVYLPL